MQQYQPCYMQPHEPEDWQKMLQNLAYALMVFIIVWATFALLTSCATHKTAEVAQKADSTASVSISRNDSVVVREVYKERLIDHFLNTTYIVSPLGDTLKEKSFERIETVNNSLQHDSIVKLQKQLENFSNIKKEYLCKKVERKLGWWEQTKIDTYEFVLIALLACIVVIVGYIFYRVKK